MMPRGWVGRTHSRNETGGGLAGHGGEGSFERLSIPYSERRWPAGARNGREIRKKKTFQGKGAVTRVDSVNAQARHQAWKVVGRFHLKKEGGGDA